MVAQVAAGLAEADRQCMADRPAGRGAPALVVAQEAHEVAGRGEAQALHLGVGALVSEFVDEARLGLALGELDRPGVDRRPGDIVPSIRLAFAHGEPCAVRARHLVRQLEGLESAAPRARNEFVDHQRHDRPAVVRRDRRGQAETEIGPRRIGIPARPDDGPAAAQRKAVAEVRHLLRIVDALRAVGDVAEQHLAAAIVDLVEDAAVATAWVLGPQDEEVGGILDLAALVERSLVDQRDLFVAARLGVDLALGDADHALIGPDVAECGAAGQRLDGLDVDRGDHVFHSLQRSPPPKTGEEGIMVAGSSARRPRRRDRRGRSAGRRSAG